MCSVLGVSVEPVTSSLKKIGSDDLRARIANYAEVERSCAAPFARCLEPARRPD
jgi:hypothetical protein